MSRNKDDTFCRANTVHDSDGQTDMRELLEQILRCTMNHSANHQLM